MKKLDELTNECGTNGELGCIFFVTRHSKRSKTKISKI